MAGRDATFPQRLRPHPRGVRGKAQGADHGDERGTQKSQGAACGHRPAGKADKKAAPVVGLYASPPGGHGVLDHRQTNRPVTEYGEEALWDGGRDAWEKMRAIFEVIRMIKRYNSYSLPIPFQDLTFEIQRTLFRRFNRMELSAFC